MRKLALALLLVSLSLTLAAQQERLAPRTKGSAQAPVTVY